MGSLLPPAIGVLKPSEQQLAHWKCWGIGHTVPESCNPNLLISDSATGGAGQQLQSHLGSILPVTNSL